MNKASKVLSSLVMAGSVLAVASGAAQASTLSWHDAPIMGTNVVDNGNGSLTVTETSGTYIIPDSNNLPSQFAFVINPVAGCDVTHTCDFQFIYSGSSVNLDATTATHAGSNYKYVGHLDGPTAADHWDWPVNVWGATAFTIGELWAGNSGSLSASGWYPEDAGLWAYTETWTGTSGDDAGAVITSVRHFCLETSDSGFCETPDALATIRLDSQTPNQSQVPEPATLALVGLGLAGFGFSRRRRS